MWGCVLELSIEGYCDSILDMDSDGIISEHDLNRMLDAITDEEIDSEQKHIIIQSVSLKCVLSLFFLFLLHTCM